MSDIFFNQLDIPRPDYQLDINGGSHGDLAAAKLHIPVVHVETGLCDFNFPHASRR